MRRIIKRIIPLLILINFLYVFSGALHFSLRSIDVYSIWLFKAKIFYLFDGIPVDLINEHIYSHPYYPILLPYLFSLVFKLMGGITEMYIFILYPFIYLAILYLNYKNLVKINIGKLMSLVLIYVYSMLSPLLGQAGRNHAGSADIILVLINSIIVFLVFRIKENKNYIYLIAILIAIAGQIKIEGVLYSSILLFLPVRKGLKVNSLVVAIAPSVLFSIWRNSVGLIVDSTYIFPGPIEFLRESLIVIVYVGKEMLNFRNWYIFWPIFWLLFMVQGTKLDIIKKVFLPTLVLLSISFAGTYTTSSSGIKPHIIGSSTRLIMQMSPFFFLVFAHKLKLLLGRIK